MAHAAGDSGSQLLQTLIRSLCSTSGEPCAVTAECAAADCAAAECAAAECAAAECAAAECAATL